MEYAVALVMLAVLTASAMDVDDVERLAEAKKDGHIVIQDLHIPSGRSLDLTGLEPGTLVEFRGRVTFGYEERKGYLVEASGTNVTIRGLPGHVFDCQGERWWDGVGGNGGKKKPKFFHVVLTDSIVEGLVVKNTPVHAFSISGSVNVSLTGIVIDNKDGRSKGHNTDAFDVYNSHSIRIANCTVDNQDDCLAVNAGDDLVFENNVCTGGHGISIGSVGGREFNDVTNVVVRNCRVVDSTNGIRIKTNRDTVGSVTNVTFENIDVVDITRYGVIIHGNYKNVGTGGPATPGVPITGLTIRNVRGNVLQNATKIFVNVANASDWTVEDLRITGGISSKSKCKGVPTLLNLPCTTEN